MRHRTLEERFWGNPWQRHESCYKCGHKKGDGNDYWKSNKKGKYRKCLKCELASRNKYTKNNMTPEAWEKRMEMQRQRRSNDR